MSMQIIHYSMITIILVTGKKKAVARGIEIGFTENWEKERKDQLIRQGDKKVQQQRNRTTQQIFEVHWWFSWAGIQAEEFKDFAIAVSTCLLLKRQDKGPFCFLFFF